MGAVQQQHQIPVVILMLGVLVVPVSVTLGTMIMMESVTIMLELVYYVSMTCRYQTFAYSMCPYRL